MGREYKKYHKTPINSKISQENCYKYLFQYLITYIIISNININRIFIYGACLEQNYAIHKLNPYLEWKTETEKKIIIQ